MTAGTVSAVQVVNIPVVQQRQVQQFMLCRRSRRSTDSVPTVQTVQKTEEISQCAVPGQGCRDDRGGATPGVHGSGGAENSMEEVKWTTTGRVSRRMQAVTAQCRQQQKANHDVFMM